jgi:hypothetical protein
MKPLKIPAVYMRGGTSKGLFFHKEDLPSEPIARDRILLRAMGSPDRYGKQIDGMGAATSSTSKVVVISRSSRPDCDVDYLFGQVAIDRPIIDWSGSCGNLTAAVGPFAISEGLVSAPESGLATIRIWQANLGRKIVAYIPMRDGDVVENGAFELDGVAFPAAEIAIDFLDPGGAELDGDGDKMFPTGNVVDRLDIPSLGTFDVTMINAGMPTIFINASALQLTGVEMQAEIDSRPELLEALESIRAHGAVAMGLADNAKNATERRPHSPKLAFVAPPQNYRSSDSKQIKANFVDLVARIISMGRLHHAMTGTGAVAIAAAAAIPGTLVQSITGARNNLPIRFGHPSGIMELGVEARQNSDAWIITKVQMRRSARQLMKGVVSVPAAAMME